jgi:tetratricopeptide (TPR) repeat protein
MSGTELRQRFEDGLALHKRGELTQAAKHYHDVLQIDPTQYSVHYLLGTLYLQSQQIEDAVKHLGEAYQHGEKTADLCNNLGVALLAQKKHLVAGEYFLQAIEMNPDYHQARFNLASNLLQQAQTKQAVRHFQIILNAEPGNQQVLGILGECAIASQDYRQAATYLEQLHNPQDKLLFKLAYCYAKLEMNQQAAHTYEKYLAHHPEHHEAWVNLSYVAERAGLLEKAVTAANKALSLHNNLPQAWNNLGVAYRSLHQLDDAIIAFETGIKHAPASSLLKYNLATTYMLSGDYAAGWAGYEERSALVAPAQSKLTSSRWNGTAVSGKRLLVTVDQGLGDTIQFARFLPMIIEESRMEVVLACQETLIDLLEYSCPEVRYCDEFQPLPDHDLNFPLMSVGKLWGLTIGDVGFEHPYLQVPNAVQERLRAEFSPYKKLGHKNIGLVWRGNPVQARDIVRSMPLTELSPLFHLPGISWFSLNIDTVTRAELREIPDYPLQDLSPLINTMTDTAALLKELDLLITVDTSVAHLAGGLGINCWTLLCHTPDWRWHLNRTDSPWYPSMKLFRQGQPNNWPEVIKKVQQELQDL